MFGNLKTRHGHGNSKYCSLNALHNAKTQNKHSCCLGNIKYIYICVEEEEEIN